MQTHDEHDNSMKSHTTGALALHPTGNQQGSYFFYNLNTGHVLNQKPRDWTMLPTPVEVIDHVHAIASTTKVPEGLTLDEFEHPEDDDNDWSYHTDDDDDGDDDHLDN